MSLAVGRDTQGGRPEPSAPRPAVAAVPRPTGPSVGLAVQIGLLAAFAGIVGVRPAGWAAAGAFALGTHGFLRRGLRRAGRRALGPADVVTLTRAILVGGVVALAGDSLAAVAPVPAVPALVVVLAVVALGLDAVDGAVARRTGTASPLGARFDMEVDAVLILALSVLLVRPLGPWVLAIGAMRYAFLAAGRMLPRFAAPLPPRFSRKVVAAGQGVVLVVALTGILPHVATVIAVLGSLASLCWSFGRDVAWLARSAA
jgi:phosphatidylglycerophosphate synthase